MVSEEHYIRRTWILFPELHDFKLHDFDIKLYLSMPFICWNRKLWSKAKLFRIIIETESFYSFEQHCFKEHGTN